MHPGDELDGWLAAVRAGPGPRCRDLGVQALREAGRRRAQARAPGPRLARVRDVGLGGGLGGRRYEPHAGSAAAAGAAGSAPTGAGRAGSSATAPTVVHLHGGGWTLGDLESHDAWCRTLAAGTGYQVLAVDQRRAPEHPWPAAVDDALTAVRAARQTGPVIVAGDSSGANLATLTCLRLRDLGEPQPLVQVLAYPNTDLTLSRRSVVELGTGFGLDVDDLRWFVEQWAPPRLRAHPRVSPLHEPDLSGLAPALVVTAEYDPLRDEGEEYAARLAAAGGATRAWREARLVHGFLTLTDQLPRARTAADRLCEQVVRMVDELARH